MIIIICICQLVTKNLQRSCQSQEFCLECLLHFDTKTRITFGLALTLRWFSCKQKIKDIELLRWKWSRLLCWKIQGSFSSQIEDSCENLNAIQIHNNTKIFSKQKNVLLWNPWISALNWAGMMSIYSTFFQTLKIFSYYWGKKILDIEIPLHWLKISQ